VKNLVNQDEDFHYIRALVLLRGGSRGEALEDLVRALLFTEDLERVQRSVSALARLQVLKRSSVWVYLAFGAIRARSRGDSALERRFLVAALRVAPGEEALARRRSRLEAESVEGAA
jgi:hypothetical protein